ncbi:BUD22-domain-containing protein [Melampsora americana]|nr:BUD22-domain-containing protein [Melampsora americana]
MNKTSTYKSKRSKLETDSESSFHQTNRAIKNVSRAVKKAKTFELQHLLRKIKLIKEPNPKSRLDPSQLPELESDLDGLRAIDPTSFATLIISLRLLKLRQTLPSSLPPVERLQGRIANKLSSNKHISKILAEETSILRTALADSSNPTTLNRTSTSEKPYNSTSRPEGEKNHEIRPRPLSDRPMKRRLESDSEESSHSSESGSNDDGALQATSRTRSQSTHQATNADENSSEISANFESGESESDEEGIESSNPTNRRPTSSTFLPALNVGYVDGSDGSDLDDPVYDRLEREMGRKNRRGQRARRAIWEKKFGKGAKHLQKIAAKKRPPPPPPKPMEKTKSDQPNPNLAPIGQRKAVHPSWEAKVKQQEALANAVPKGKKIVFD